MWFKFISLFPELIHTMSQNGVIGRSLADNRLKLSCVNPRDFSMNKHGQVDDKPFGGGAGMVMQAPPTVAAIRAAKQEALSLGQTFRVIEMSPQGTPLTQQKVEQLATQDGLIFVCGRYEGLDQRITMLEVDEQCSLGDYVISGGELAAMVLMDAVSRLQPEVLGDSASMEQDSFSDGLLDWPHYTRPAEFEGLKVPDVLLSGDHKAIALWRKKQALGMTWLKRPDLLKDKQLTSEQKRLLEEFKHDYKHA